MTLPRITVRELKSLVHDAWRAIAPVLLAERYDPPGRELETSRWVGSSPHERSKGAPAKRASRTTKRAKGVRAKR